MNREENNKILSNSLFSPAFLGYNLVITTKGIFPQSKEVLYEVHYPGRHAARRYL